MPELPEVETVMRGLAAATIGQKISHVDVRRDIIRRPVPRHLAGALIGAKITGYRRRAKYILMDLNTNQTVVVHLGMSGRMTISKGAPEEPKKHDHVIFSIGRNITVSFNDPRRFGLIDLIDTPLVDEHALFAHLGAEPLERAFDAPYLASRLAGRKTPVKIAIMDQELVVGVGNIYASEALFACGIDPRRAAGTLNYSECNALARAIKAVLRKAISSGGSSLRDYVQANGELGNFQNNFAVYDRAGFACKNCTCNVPRTGGIEKITQGGRSTYFCPRKQH